MYGHVGQARHIPLDDFIAFVDEGGYARYAARLKALSGIIGERYDGRAAMISQQFSTYPTPSAGCAASLGAGNYPAVPARTAGRVARPRSRRSTRVEYAADTSATSATSAPARPGSRSVCLPRPAGHQIFTPAARISKAAWSGSPWWITAGDGPMHGRACSLSALSAIDLSCVRQGWAFGSCQGPPTRCWPVRS